MDLRIEKLKEKYWAGETSNEEEKELKAWFRENPSLTKDSRYFSLLDKKKKESPEYPFAHPGKNGRSYWWSLAALILVLITVGVFTLRDNSQQDYAIEDPTEALEVTRASLMMVSEGLNKGKTYSTELKKINKAKEIVNN
jgi:hypothetical protein